MLCDFTPITPGSHCSVFTTHTVYTLVTVRELESIPEDPRYELSLFEHERGKRFPHFRCSITLTKLTAIMTRAGYFDSETGKQTASAILDYELALKIEDMIMVIAYGSDAELYRFMYLADKDELRIRAGLDVIRIADNHIERVRGGM